MKRCCAIAGAGYGQRCSSLSVGSSRVFWQREPARDAGLLADSQLADHVAIAVRVRALQVVQKAAALGHQHEEATAGAMILLVCLEVLGQLANTLAENGNLHLRTSGVGVMRAELGDDLGFLCGGQHGWLLPLVYFSWLCLCFLAQSTSLSVSIKDSTPETGSRRSGGSL